MLAAAGLPIYIHAPKFYVDEYGISLATLGFVLFVLRLLDVVQDPLLGALSARLRNHRAAAVSGGLAAIALGMLMLFAVPAGFAPVLWFAISLVLVFSAYSFLTLTFYAQGIAKADELGVGGHLRLARWRESGALLGVCIAAIAPVALANWMDAPFTGYAIGFAIASFGVFLAMRLEWVTAMTPTTQGQPGDWWVVLGDPLARRLLLIAFVNAAPVAITSTLFLFFVESRLDAPGMEGPLLLAFFLAAALSAPIWGRLADRFGSKSVLLAAMVLAIGALLFALGLGAGDVIAFAFVSIASGAAMGADLTLLPALFAARMARVSPGGEVGFGLWSFMSKATLALAAIAAFPALQAAGFQSGVENDEHALWALTLAYAGLPCALKVLAIALLASTDLKEN